MANPLTISDAALLERIQSIETTPQVQAGDYVCRWPPPAYWSDMQPGTGAFCARREHMYPDLHLPNSVKRDYTSDLSCIAADTKSPPGGHHICAPTLGKALITLMRMGDIGVMGGVENKIRGVNLSLDKLITGLEAATSANDQKHMGVNQLIGSLTTGLEAATVAIAEIDNRHTGVKQLIGSLTMGLEAAAVAIAELDAMQNQIGQKVGEVLREMDTSHRGFEAATSAIAELSLRHAP